MVIITSTIIVFETENKSNSDLTTTESNVSSTVTEDLIEDKQDTVSLPSEAANEEPKEAAAVMLIAENGTSAVNTFAELQAALADPTINII